MKYDWILLYLHVIAGVLFLGDIIVTFVWKRYADRTEDLKVMRFGADLVILTDRLFIMPAATFIVLSGLGLAHLRGYTLLGTHWVLAALVLFGLSGLFWLLFLVPNQKQQKRLLSEAESAETIAKTHAELQRKWLVWGVVSTLFAFATLLMMIVK